MRCAYSSMVPRPPRKPSLLALRAGSKKLVMFYTYVLQSRKDGKLYIGFSENLKQRILEHQQGLVDATKDRRPLKLIYYESCLDKYSALEREKYFKTGFGRRFLKIRLKLKNIPKLDSTRL